MMSTDAILADTWSTAPIIAVICRRSELPVPGTVVTLDIDPDDGGWPILRWPGHQVLSWPDRLGGRRSQEVTRTGATGIVSHITTVCEDYSTRWLVHLQARAAPGTLTPWVPPAPPPLSELVDLADDEDLDF